MSKNGIIRLAVSVYQEHLDVLQSVNAAMGFGGNNSQAVRYIIHEYRTKILNQPQLPFPPQETPQP